MPDHLSLPKYSDKFVADEDANLVRCLHESHKGIGLNELRWTMGLRKMSHGRSGEALFGRNKKSTGDYETYDSGA